MARDPRNFRSSHPEVFLRKVVLKICSKFIGESTRAECDFNKVALGEITLRHRCSPVNLLHIFRITFPKNTSGRLLLEISTLVKTPFLAEHLLEAILEHLLAATSKWLPVGGYFYGQLLVAHLYGSFTNILFMHKILCNTSQDILLTLPVPTRTMRQKLR